MTTTLQALQTDTPPFDAGEFRRALGTFPTGVAIITTRGPDGKPVGLTCNSFSSVSLDPPLVLWSLRNASKSMDAFQGANGFAINVLAEDQSKLSARFASGSIVDKFEGVGHSDGFGGVPLIDDCVARFHCTTFAQHAAGDHVIFIGKVERFEHGREQDPLVFYKGAYMMLAQSLRELAAQGRVSVKSLIEARAGVYELLLRLACERGEAIDFEAMEKHLADMDAQTERGDMAARALAALEYFSLITKAAHNDVLALVAQTLATLMHHSVMAQANAMPYAAMHQPELTPLRRQMLSCMRARDAEGAAAAVRAYFGHVEHFQRQAGTVS
ncbi:flavin reductase [Hydrogenophaga palleronii]|uniref:flavin reductase n=1 Tax=Hydrogenophaga palleronii TaxID=65655 RepID=UPI000A924FFE|nr:flavin reductase [Hydrogenophaga palleronii]